MKLRAQAHDAAVSAQKTSYFKRAGQAMPSPTLSEEASPVLPPPSPGSVDTVRALCHDLRQPLMAILLLAQARGGDAEVRFDGITREAQWLSEVIECVIGGAAGDLPERVDVGDLVAGCVDRAQPTATCHMAFFRIDQAMVVALPVALSRAVSCLLDNALRAAGSEGQVTVSVSDTGKEIVIGVIDDGPGLGLVPTNNSLGLTITRALVSACGGRVVLKPGHARGVVAEIVLPSVRHCAVTS